MSAEVSRRPDKMDLDNPSRVANSPSNSHTGPITVEQKEMLERVTPQLQFLALPEVLQDEQGQVVPHWRIRLDIDADPPDSLGYDVYAPIAIGREAPSDAHDIDPRAFVDLMDYDAGARGVSRLHVELRPTPHGLFVVDLSSLNGTYKNGVRLKPNSPTPIGNRDTLSLGLLHVTLNIIDAPHQEAEWVARQATLGQALTEMAKTVTTKLKVEDVLTTAVDYALGLTHAQEASLWLLQPDMRDLLLEAARGIAPQHVGNLSVPITGSAAGDTILTGQPQLRTAKKGGFIELARGYNVESALFVPVSLGGLSLGVLSVSNSTPGHDFNERDQEMLTSLADFAAIALQNSRTLQATDQALRESLRAQREATARALEGTRLKTEFLATVSHELRSPLHTINGFSKMALRGTLGTLTEGLRDALDRIYGNGTDLLAMVDNLLDTLRIESQEMELAHEQFSPGQLASDLLAGLQPVAQDKGLVLNLSTEAVFPETLMGDPNRVRQVLLNLVTNAVKFTDTGGVEVQLRTIGVHLWSVSVADTGRGIAPEHQEMIFERFRQVDQSSTREHGGVGLGLAIAHDLVQLMGGTLRVTSDGVEGRGSTFTMTLPLVQPGGDEVLLSAREDTLDLGE